MKSISGVRGIVGRSLTPAVLVNYAAAFARFVKKGTVVIGRDGRPSGLPINELVKATLALCGCRVIDLGLVPTPTVELAVLHYKAAGGIAVTASHNPAEWNALKFFNASGEFITQQQFLQLEKMVASGRFDPQTADKLGRIEYDDKMIERHIRAVLKIKAVKPSRIKKARFKVVVDAINGAGSLALPRLLEKLGVRVHCINCKGDGDFYRKPEPTPDNLKDLGRAVRKNKADLGLACDPDADRLALVNEKGQPIGEELTLTLAVAYYLMHNKGNVAVNLSTSMATIDAARMVGCKTFLSPVGEANVIAEMKKRRAVIGGEGNGGVILPECHYGRDALVGAGLIMSYLADINKPLSELAETIPPYFYIKKKAPLAGDFERKIEKTEKIIKKAFTAVKVDRRDGLRFDIPGGWILVRKSNTEPIYRLMGEARTKTEIDQLESLIRKALK